jgi:O-antigen/teichoic acid export membrane protein
MLTAVRSKVQALTKHQGFRRYAANTSWMMAEQMLRIAAGLLVGIWVARYLGPEQFGLFSYVLAFTAIFGGVAKLGLDGILVRDLVNNPELRDTYLGTAFWLKVMGAFLVMAIMALIIPFTSNDATTNLFIFIIAAGLVFQSFEVVEFYFQSKVLAKVVSICKVTQLALSSIIKVYLVLTQAELFWFVCVTAFDAFSLAVSYFIAYKVRGNSNFFKCFDISIAKKLLKDSWPLILSSLVVMVYMRIDQVMINEMLGDYEVGIYSAAARLSEAMYFLPVLLSASLFPAILSAKKKSYSLYQLRLSRLYSLLIWSAIFMALIVSLAGHHLILILYGSEYSASGYVLEVHVWAMPFVFLLVASGKWYIAEGYTVLAFYRNAMAAIINVIGNYFLIPEFGVVGAAWSTLFSFMLSSIIFDVISFKTRHQLIMKLKSLIWIK